MAVSEELKIVIKAEAKNAIKELKQTQKASTGVAHNFKNIAKSLLGPVGLTVAVGALGRAAVKSAREMMQLYGVQEQAERGLQNAIDTTGRAAEINAQSLFKFASELQKVSTYGDEAIIAAMTMTQQLANLDQEGLEKVTPAILDFSTAMGVDLQTAATLVGKTLGSTTNALSRYGIQIDATADPATKLNQLTDEMTEKFGGMAEVMGETALGSAEQLRNAWGDLKEAGGLILERVMRPMRDTLTDLVTGFAEWINAVADTKKTLDTISDVRLPDWMDPNKQRIEEIENQLQEFNEILAKYELRLKAGIETNFVWNDTIYEGATGVDFLKEEIKKLEKELLLLNAGPLIAEQFEGLKELNNEYFPETIDELVQIQTIIDDLAARRAILRAVGATPDQISELQIVIDRFVALRNEIQATRNAITWGEKADLPFAPFVGLGLDANIIGQVDTMNTMLAMTAHRTARVAAEIEYLNQTSGEGLPNILLGSDPSLMPEFVNQVDKLALNFSELDKAFIAVAESGSLVLDIIEDQTKAMQNQGNNMAAMVAAWEAIEKNQEEAEEALQNFTDTLATGIGSAIGTNTLLFLEGMAAGSKSAEDNMRDFIDSIARAMPQLLFSAGLRALGDPKIPWQIGAGLIAASGVAALLSGIIKGSTDIQETVPSPVTSGMEKRRAALDRGLGYGNAINQQQTTVNVYGHVLSQDALESEILNTQSRAASGY